MSKIFKLTILSGMLFCFVGSAFSQDIQVQNATTDMGYLKLIRSNAKSITLLPDVDPNQSFTKIGSYTINSGQQAEIDFALTFGKSMDVLHTSIIRLTVGQLGTQEILCSPAIENEIIHYGNNQKAKVAAVCEASGDVSITLTPTA